MLIVLCLLAIMIVFPHSLPIAYGAEQEQVNEQHSKNLDPQQSKKGVENLIKSVQGAPTTIHDSQKLEHQKLQQKVEKLSTNVENLQGLIRRQTAIGGAFLGGIFVSILGAIVSIFIARRQLIGALDQSVHEARLKAYPKLVQATAKLAIYFPDDLLGGSINYKDCEAMGRALSTWYFQHGGLLLTKESRDAYFLLAMALTKASKADPLCVPRFPNDAEVLNKEKIGEYRKCLSNHYDGLRVDNTLKSDDVVNWNFGDNKYNHSNPNENSCNPQACPTQANSLRFKDYLFLQQISSTLRTQLTNDLGSRRPPVGETNEGKKSKWEEFVSSVF